MVDMAGVVTLPESVRGAFVGQMGLRYPKNASGGETDPGQANGESGVPFLL